MASRPLRSTRALVSVATVLLVVSLVALDRERSSPGPLSAVHSREPELRGLVAEERVSLQFPFDPQLEGHVTGILRHAPCSVWITRNRTPA